MTIDTRAIPVIDTVDAASPRGDERTIGTYGIRVGMDSVKEPLRSECVIRYTGGRC